MIAAECTNCSSKIVSQLYFSGGNYKNFNDELLWNDKLVARKGETLCVKFEIETIGNFNFYWRPNHIGDRFFIQNMFFFLHFLQLQLKDPFFIFVLYLEVVKWWAFYKQVSMVNWMVCMVKRKCTRKKKANQQQRRKWGFRLLLSATVSEWDLWNRF